ncbi:protein-(glutamine-N5) methyltransferase, release factor-specific [Candidatus Palibaumannia cicadellinicola]|uniref:Release factor glutamine methyltransferase n=1 Tax=Candidatus Palibaumannia cicadellinicola TaxID=186490 RepID=A0A2N4XWX9_9GAMM|nr:peptide chain release factor N(5)-glutamine methyltransferase [Candidatus Baumannia cicadellinicola]PLK58607.1 protein-(glutamine-N5) methyltransferase, release factor-specific [Candidatus Baumannia cicadellinicola]
MTWQQWLVQASDRLTASPNPRLDAEMLLGQVAGIGRARLLAFGDTLLDEAHCTQLENLLKRRVRGEPLAYITGEWEFWSLPLRVSTDTIIPRPDTECLVEQALYLMLPTKAEVLDLGTGTGAIMLALASERPSWRLTGVDINLGAITLAYDNAVSLGVTNVLFLCGNWFKPLRFQATRYSLIVSNPPYIDADDSHLNQGDIYFEPKSALVADNHGIADIAAICRDSGKYLQYRGWLVLEHGWQQGAEVRALLAQAGFIHITTVRDYGDNERVSLGQWVHS